VDREKDVGLRGVRGGGAVVEADGRVRRARQKRPVPSPLERLLHRFREGERRVLLQRAARTLRALLASAVAGVDHHRLDVPRRSGCRDRRGGRRGPRPGRTRDVHDEARRRPERVDVRREALLAEDDREFAASHQKPGDAWRVEKALGRRRREAHAREVQDDLVRRRLDGVGRRLREPQDDLRHVAEVRDRGFDRDLDELGLLRRERPRRPVPRERLARERTEHLQEELRLGPRAEARRAHRRGEVHDLRVHDGDRRVRAEDGRAALDLHLVRARPLVPRDRALEGDDRVTHEQERPAVALLGADRGGRLSLAHERSRPPPRRATPRRERKAPRRGGGRKAGPAGASPVNYGDSGSFPRAGRPAILSGHGWGRPGFDGAFSDRGARRARPFARKNDGQIQSPTAITLSRLN
jgi:hypothetical protein